MNYNKNDILILSMVQALGGRNKLTSKTIQKLTEKTERSATKVRATVRLLIEDGLLEEGLKLGNAKTYYITDKGLELLESLNCPIKDLEN